LVEQLLPRWCLGGATTTSGILCVMSKNGSGGMRLATSADVVKPLFAVFAWWQSLVLVGVTRDAVYYDAFDHSSLVIAAPVSSPDGLPLQ
jgi:hypothetical protein